MDYGESVRPSDSNTKDKQSRVYIADVVEKDIKKVNEIYFGSYSSFGIHRDMISDKIRTDAYSLFAAQAGASRVVSIEASEKMATVATQMQKTMAFGGVKTTPKVITTALVLLKLFRVCSVLFARDRWLKPGGAILPDTATIFVARFGKGGTSLPFWGHVYDFNMSSIGKEVVEDAAKFPIVDIVNHHDLVTNSAVLQTRVQEYKLLIWVVTDGVLLQSFDLVTMKPDEEDFTASAELEAKLDSLASNHHYDLENKATSCYGIVLWFETGFTGRLCKEMSTVLSTPYTPKTHW
ncbi:hypothetical protein CRYUN_Cryun09bG0137100 [Craigia yunnanensis]